MKNFRREITTYHSQDAIDEINEASTAALWKLRAIALKALQDFPGTDYVDYWSTMRDYAEAVIKSRS